MRWRPAVAIVAVAAVIARADAPYVRYADGRLSVRLESVPLADVLDRLASATGAAIRGDIPESRDVTARFDDVPLEQALPQLLGSQNYSLRFGADGALSSVTMIGPPGVPTVPVPTSRPPTFLRTARVTGALRDALGADDVQLMKLFEAAARQPDPAIRRDATRVLVDAIESDAAFRTVVVTMDDAGFADVLRRQGGDKASQLAGDIMGAARSYELRAKALRVMEQLRQPVAATSHPD
jgi:hypothetical protein